MLWLTLAEAAPAGVHTDGHGERGPLDIHRASISQSRARLTVGVVTARRWSPTTLVGKPAMGPAKPQDYLCLELRQRSRKRRYCLKRAEAGAPAVMIGGRLNQAGRIRNYERLRGVGLRRPSRRSAKISFPYPAAKLRPGSFGWRLRSGWGDPSCAPPEDPAPAPLKQGPSRKASRSCLDRAPNRSFYKARVIRPRIVGCTRDEDVFNRNGSRSSKRIALTFDDGPSGYTGRVIDILNRYRADGTFFVVGSQIPGRTGLLRRMRNGDHEIGNHSLNHETGGASSYSLHETDRRIRAATGFKPCTYRPPGGHVSSTTTRTAWEMGMSNILWDVDPQDWRQPGSSAIYSRVVGSARSGSIVLLHDGGGNRSGTVGALDNIIRTLKGRGYKLVTVTKLLNERYRWVP